MLQRVEVDDRPRTWWWELPEESAVSRRMSQTLASPLEPRLSRESAPAADVHMSTDRGYRICCWPDSGSCRSRTFLFFLRCRRTRSCEQAQLFGVGVQMSYRPFQFELRLLPDEWKVETPQNTRWNFQQSSMCSVRDTLASKFAFSKRL